ncbi:hypothetical protein [Roseiconus lacunae]|uniref:hypothetical protein n=1 Tax=Roseiconus lacunae TaxID=2605694 RepID=UPI0011F3EC6D|nr:hypothetical protein [Roseiconus lacunae]
MMVACLRRRLLVGLCNAVLFGAAVPAGLLTESVLAQDADSASSGKIENAKGATRSDRLYAEFDRTGKSLDFKTKDGQVYQWQSDPLFRFSAEGMNFGSVYVWTDPKGHLALVGTIGSIPISGDDFEFVEFHLMNPSPIEPLRIGKLGPKVWEPNVDTLALKPIPDAPAVAAQAGTRLRQMRGLARRFSAEMINAGQTNTLRLLPQPLYRYQNSTEEFDGALFAFVWDTGTDPEVLLRIELIGSGDEARWAYQPMRFTYRAVNASLDQKRIWEQAEFYERDQSRQSAPYMTTLTRQIP